MAAKSKDKEPVIQDGKKILEKKLSAAIFRSAKGEKYPYIRDLLRECVNQGIFPVELLADVPAHASKVGKTRFDQIYEAALSLAFPGYGEKIRKALGDPEDHEMKVWKVILPKEYNVTHTILKARTYQEAFAKGCDYACRIALRLFKRIPADLTIRVKFLPERTANSFFAVRQINRKIIRQKRKVQGRVFTERDIAGARMSALGHPRGSPELRVARYIERRDLQRVREGTKQYRITDVVTEHFASANPEKLFQEFVERYQKKFGHHPRGSMASYDDKKPRNTEETVEELSEEQSLGDSVEDYSVDSGPLSPDRSDPEID